MIINGKWIWNESGILHLIATSCHTMSVKIKNDDFVSWIFFNEKNRTKLKNTVCMCVCDTFVMYAWIGENKRLTWIFQWKSNKMDFFQKKKIYIDITFLCYMKNRFCVIFIFQCFTLFGGEFKWGFSVSNSWRSKKNKMESNQMC